MTTIPPPDQAFAAAFHDRDQAGMRVALASGANVNADQDDKGNSALHLATLEADLAVMELLLSAGADPNQTNRFHRTPPLLALSHRHDATDVMRMLLDNGGVISAPDPVTEGGLNHRGNPAEHALRYSSSDTTLLGEACECSEPELAALLLERGADVNEQDAYGRSALHRCFDSYKRDDPTLVLLLTQHGARMDLLDDEMDSPLHICAMYGRPKTTQLLLALGADANGGNANKQTPLHVISAMGEEDMEEGYEVIYATTKLLIGAGADMATVSEQGRTALHIAASSDNAAALAAILDAGFPIDTKVEGRGAALHIAAFRGAVGALEKLVARGADIALLDAQGRTAETVATEEKQVECADVLRRAREAVLLEEQIKHGPTRKARM